MRYEEILPVTNVWKFKHELWFTECALRMHKWLDGKPQAPLRIDAEITRRCNLNCIFCSRRASSIDLTEESKKIELPKERWVELARESGELGVKEWNISGIGEPMCRADVTLATMEMLKAYEIFGELTTNGTIWKDDWVKKTVEIGWDSICISIDAPNAKTHDSLRGSIGAFKKATTTIKKFRYWRNKLHSEVPSITINVVLNRKNYTLLPQMVRLAKRLGADAIFVEPMVLFSSHAASLKLVEKDMQVLPHYVQEARNLGEEYNVLPTISCVGIEREFDKELVEKTGSVRDILIADAKRYSAKILSVPCYAPWFFTMIRTDGSITHCGEWEGSIENIRNKGLWDAWLSANFEKIRNQFLGGSLPLSCNKCRPNVINDTRQIRKFMKSGSNISYLHQKIRELLDENMRLRRLLLLSKGAKNRLANMRDLHEQQKELLKIKNSLTFRLISKIGNTLIGKKIKSLFGVHV